MVVFFLLAAAVIHAAPASPPVWAGQSIPDLLEAYRQAGWSIVYSNNLVTSNLLVLRSPTSTDPEQTLSEVLAAHGLAVRSVDDTWFVVRAARTSSDEPGLSSILVIVKNAATGTRVSDPSVTIVASDTSPERLGAGSVQIESLEPGDHTLLVTAPGFEPVEHQLRVEPDRVTTHIVEMRTAKSALQKLTVTASHYSLSTGLESALAAFSRQQVENMPDLGDDPLRTVQRLPGTAGSGFSAKSYVRGGDNDETLLVFDGLELIDPFHVRDYQSIFSTIDQRAISSVRVYTGGFPATYGDRLSGVMVIESLDPTLGLHHEIGLSVFHTSVLSSGTFARENGEWLLSARRSNLDKIVDEDFGKPSYNDVLVHVGASFGNHTTFSFNGLVANDDVLVITENEVDELKSAQTKTRNAQFWLNIHNEWTDRLSSQTVLSASDFSNNRRGVADDPEKVFGWVSDERTLKVLGAKQDWQWRPSGQHLLSWGAQAKNLKATYDYSSYVEFLGFFADFENTGAPIIRDTVLKPAGNSYSAYLSERAIVGQRLILEGGLRWDRQTYLDAGDSPLENDSQWSPRVSALYKLGPNTDLRASWGSFYQSQGIHQMQVEDGVNRFFPAQRADHSILSLEHRFANKLAVRVEAFHKSMTSLKPRYENVLDPLALLPELEPDRVRIEPEKARSRGIELLVTQEGAGEFSWWASYSFAEAEDIEMGRVVPRSWDQRHAINAGLGWTGQHWNLGLAARHRSGWPTTELIVETLSVTDESQQVTARFGDRNGLRLGSFSSVDIRASRYFKFEKSRLKLFLEVTNVFNKDNPCCIDYDLDEADDGTISVDRQEELWFPRLPAVGLLWEF